MNAAEAKEEKIDLAAHADSAVEYKHNDGVLEAEKIARQKLDQLKAEGRYRVFIDINRQRGAFPLAHNHTDMDTPLEQQSTHMDVALTDNPDEVTVWCNNDYLGMGQHPAVVGAMLEAVAVRVSIREGI